MSAGKSIRMKANDGIHMLAGDEIRLHAKAQGNDSNGDLGIHIKSEEDIHVESVATLDILTGGLARVQIGSTLDIKVAGATKIQTASTLDIDTGGATKLTSGGALDIDVTGATKITQSSSFDVNAGGAANITGSTFDVSGGSAITLTAGVIDLNGPPAATAATAGSAATPVDAIIAFESFEISRQPAHEPWARVYSLLADADKDLSTSFTDEFGYDDANVGKSTARPDRPKDRNARWNR